LSTAAVAGACDDGVFNIGDREVTNWSAGPAPGAVFDAVQHSRKPMDLSSWLGASRSDTRRYREDSQQRQGGKDAVLCAA